MCSDYCTFCLAQLIHVIYLLIVYGLLRYFKRNSRDSGLLNPTGPLPIVPSQAILCAKSQIQAQSDKEST